MEIMYLVPYVVEKLGFKGIDFINHGLEVNH